MKKNDIKMKIINSYELKEIYNDYVSEELLPNKSEIITIRLPKKLLNLVKKHAKREGIQFTRFLRITIAKEMYRLYGKQY